MEWTFSTTAADSIRESTARQNIWHGSVRSGKTISSIIRWLTFIRDAPDEGALIMVGKTERTLKRNVLDIIEGLLPRTSYRLNRGEGEVYIFGRRVLIAGANDERAESKIRGLTVAGVYGDELTLWPESFYRQMLARMSVVGAKLFGTTNPDGPYHWLKADFLDRADLNLRAFHFRLDDNVALDPAYVAALKAEYGPGTLWYKRFIDGLWVTAEGAVYDFFHEDHHTIDNPDPEPDRIDVSIDYGTSNATSAGAYAAWRHPPDGHPRVVRWSGYYYDGHKTGHQKTDSEYAREIREWMQTLPRPVRHVLVDPSAASFISELRRTPPGQPRLSVRPALNDVVDGIRTQAKMLRNGEYKIRRDPSNDPCIKDYGAYLWDARAQARGEDKPLKQHDHTKDEERYYLHTVHGQAVTSARTARALYR